MYSSKMEKSMLYDIEYLKLDLTDGIIVIILAVDLQ